MPNLARRVVNMIDPRQAAPRAVEEELTEEEPQPQWLDVVAGPLAGRQLLLPPHLAWDGMTKGTFEPVVYETAERISGLVSSTAWDVGAHMGYHSLILAKAVGPSGRVIAFEPNPHNVERLRENLSRNGDLAERVTVVEEALSDRDGMSSFVFSSLVDDGTSSGSHLTAAYAPEEATAYSSFEQTRVKTVKADTLVKARSVPPPVFIKVDVEGAEELVLAGAFELLSDARPTLLIEVHHVRTMYHVTRLLQQADYRLELVGEQSDRRAQVFLLALPSPA